MLRKLISFFLIMGVTTAALANTNVPAKDVTVNTSEFTGILDTSDTSVQKALRSVDLINKADVGLDAVDNTSDTDKPVSTAQQALANTKENLANKSTTTTLGTSNTLYPTQNAVKTYVDTLTATVGGGWTKTGVNITQTTQTDSVGIGSTSPTALLDVAGLAKAKALTVSGATTLGGTATIADTVGIGSTSPRGKLDINGDVYSGALTVAGSSTISGNVGVGTVNPRGKMDIAGPIFASSLTISGQTTIGGNVGIGTSSPRGRMEVDAAIYSGALVVSGASTFLGNVGVGTVYPRGRFEVDTSIYSGSLVVSGASTLTGAVGIGTTSPGLGSKLEVDGAIYVRGGSTSSYIPISDGTIYGAVGKDTLSNNFDLGTISATPVRIETSGIARFIVAANGTIEVDGAMYGNSMPVIGTPSAAVQVCFNPVGMFQYRKATCP